MFVRIALGCAAIALASPAAAVVVTEFDGIVEGTTAFDATVTGTGATVVTDNLAGATNGVSIDRGAYTITKNDGGVAFVVNTPRLTGPSISIDPQIDTTLGTDDFTGRADPLAYFGSGITFTFDDPVNAFGFEVDDWATCCFEPVTELFISFDGGAPILVASATESSDGLFPSLADPAVDDFAIFVGAIDDSGDFSSVSFWGNGLGEILRAGGTVRYALVDQGSLPPVMAVIPLPAAGWLLIAGIGAMGAMRRRRG